MYGLMLLNSGSSTFLRDILRIFLFCSRFSFLWSLSCLRYTLTCIASHVTSRPLSDTFCITRVIMSSCPLHTNSVVCVCVFFPSILDIKFVGRTSRGHTGGRSHRIFNPPSFCGACLDFCREKDSAIPFPRRP